MFTLAREARGLLPKLLGASVIIIGRLKQGLGRLGSFRHERQTAALQGKRSQILDHLRKGVAPLVEPIAPAFGRQLRCATKIAVVHCLAHPACQFESEQAQASPAEARIARLG